MYDQPKQHIKMQRHYFADKGPSSQGYGFSNSHVWMWELHSKESWALKNWCFWTVELEKTLESLLDCKEIQPVNPQGNQSWIFFGRTDAEAETAIVWPPDVKNWLIGKNMTLGKTEGRRRREQQRMRWLDGITDSMDMSLSNSKCEGEGSLVCCSPCGREESDTTERLNWWTMLTKARPDSHFLPSFNSFLLSLVSFLQQIFIDFLWHFKSLPRHWKRVRA